MPTDFTIITTSTHLQITADRYAFDTEGDLYCYRGGEDSDGESVAHVPKRRFVAIFETDHGTTTDTPQLPPTDA